MKKIEANIDEMREFVLDPYIELMEKLYDNGDFIDISGETLGYVECIPVSTYILGNGIEFDYIGRHEKENAVKVANLVAERLCDDHSAPFAYNDRGIVNDVYIYEDGYGLIYKVSIEDEYMTVFLEAYREYGK